MTRPEPQSNSSDIEFIETTTDLTDAEYEEVINLANALKDKYAAEADKEAQLKRRILYQRTAKEMLPFVVYCVTFGTVAVVSLLHIINLDGYKFYWSLGALILILILPLFLLPKLLWQRWFGKEQSEG